MQGVVTGGVFSIRDNVDYVIMSGIPNGLTLSTFGLMTESQPCPGN